MGYETLLEQIKAVCAWNSLSSSNTMKGAHKTAEDCLFVQFGKVISVKADCFKFFSTEICRQIFLMS